MTILRLFAIAAASAAAPPPKVPRDAPYCAAPSARPIFLSPMGEPFRGERGGAWPSAAWAAGADRNHDGAIDRDEFLADARRFFATLDTDKDGRIAPEEVDRYEREVAPEIALYQSQRHAMMQRRRSAPRNGESDYGGPLGAGEYAWLNVPEPVAATDADMNRMIDRTEFEAAAARRFETLDSAHAGALRVATLPHTPYQIEVEGPCRPAPKPKRDARDERLGDVPPIGAPR